jgi:hypothetical protein
MPEGNEIHRWAERHYAAFGLRPVRVDGPQGRFTDSAVIDGRKLQRVMAVGKHLGYDFGKDRILHVHLGLQGDFTEGSGPLRPVKGALRLRMWNAEAVKRPAGADTSKPHRWYSEDDGSDNLAAEKVAWVELRGPMDGTRSSERGWGRKICSEGQEEQKDDWRAVDGPVGGGWHWKYLSCRAVVSGATEPVYAGEGSRGEHAAVDMEGCGCIDAGGDDRSEDRDHEAERPTAQEGAGIEGGGALCVPEARAALFCLRD